MEISNPTIRVTLSHSPIASEATVAALNKVIQSIGEATLLHDKADDEGSKTLVIEHPNDDAGYEWCQTMKQRVFPGEQVVWIRPIDDPAALGLAYRLPESFLQLTYYIAYGKVLYSPSTRGWEVSENEVGCFEEGYETEEFADWMRRQISRLESC